MTERPDESPAPTPPAASVGPDGSAPPASGPPGSGEAPSAFSLRDYALLADGERGAVVDPRGDIAWLCAPSWDSPPVFAGLLGGPGRFRVSPVGRCVWGGWYEPGSLIWRNRWVTDRHLVVECREALVHPGDPQRLVLLRRLTARQGTSRVRLVLELPAAPLETAASGLHHSDDGAWTARLGSLHARLTVVPALAVGQSGTDIAVSGGNGAPLVLSAECDVAAGQAVDLVLEIATSPPAGPVDVDRAWAATEHAWAERVPRLPDVLDEADARHSAAVLCGLTTASGAMVASATAGLPERAEQGRNYDYRYAWIRDQAYAGHAAYTAGLDSLGDAAVAFVGARLLADGADLRPAYTVRGEPIPGISELGLPGYPGGQAVVGNAVRDQRQLDVFGESLYLLGTAGERGRVDPDGLAAAARAVEAVEQRWAEPDAGIWELDDRWWVHSRLSVVSGLNRWAAVGGGPADLADRASQLADRVLAETERRGTHPSGRWQRAPDDDRVDAALLVGGLRGAVPVDHPRTAATLAAVQTELGADGSVYRYRPDERPLGAAEGSFLLCGFWTALAEAQAGQHVAATRRLERALASSGTAGLYSEEYDTTERQLRGNLPQAFVHAVALEACARFPGLVPGARPDPQGD